MSRGTCVLGSSFVLFWEMTMLVSFHPAEEVREALRNSTISS